MKKLKSIYVMQVWQTELSHMIHRGICDYARLCPDWEISAMPLNNLKPDAPHWKIDGLIASLSSGRHEMVQNAPFPVVSTYSSSRIPDTIPQIDDDHVASGQLAAETLQALGHEHFACLSVDTTEGLVVRAEGFCAKLKERGIEIVPFYTSHGVLHGQEDEVVQWLKEQPKPLALFVTSDITARALLKLCLMNHLSVPGEIALLGCENDRTQCKGITPDISSIELPYYRIGYEAARTLDLLLQNKPLKDRVVLLPPKRAVTRTSTDTLAVPDPHLRRAIQYIREHVDDRIDATALASEVGVSLRVLQKRFKQELHRTPVEEFHRAKVERIKELLTTTSLSLGELADRTSFATEYYMGSIFKRYTGQTPGQYRKHHRVR